MNTKLKFGILALAASIWLILPVYAASRAAGFPSIAPMKLYTPALAQTREPSAPKPLILTDEEREYPLGLYMETLEDTTGYLTIQDVSSLPYSDQFIPSQDEAPTFGYTASTYWVRFRLRNESQLSDHWLLEVGFPNMHYVDLYLPSPQGDGYVTEQSGVLRPFNTRDIPYNHIIFNLPLAPNEEQTFYMRFQNGASMTLPLTVWFPEAFFQAGVTEQLILGMFYGVLLIILVYNLFLLFSLREVSYLYYVGFLASAILFFVSYDAYANQYLWRDQFALINHSVPLFFILSLASITLFTDSFLEIRARHPKLHKLIVLVMAGWGIALLLMPFVSYHTIFNLIAPFGVVSLGLVVAAGLISWRSGYRPARYFLLAWLGLLLGVIIHILVRLGFAPSTTFTEQFLRVGIVWLVAFWAIALADRINLLRAEKEKASLEALASETRYRQLVETMNDGLTVTDEMGRLTYANQRIAEMLGYSPDELMGHLVADFVDEENKLLLSDQLAMRQAGSTNSYELKMQRKDGSDLFAVVSPIPVFEEGRQYRGSIAIATDITERVLANRQLEQRVTERTHELSTLLELSQEITAFQGLDYILNSILERLKTILDLRGSAIIAFEEECWRIRAARPASLAKIEELFLLTEDAGMIADAFESGKPVLLRNPQDDEAQLNGLKTVAIQLPQDFLAISNSWLGVPLRRQDRLVGLLMLSSVSGDGFSDNQQKVTITFANQAAIVIENNQLLKQAQALAAAGERNRLAQDLHDSVTQTLFTASVLAQATPRIWNKDPELASQNMEELNVLIRGALAEMRSMLLELRSGELNNQMLSQLLATLADAGRVRTRAAISLSIMGDPTLQNNITMTFYRIAQEALNNAINHAGSTQINIILHELQDSVELSIKDDGVGFDPDTIPEGHLGVNIMLERAAQIGANLRDS